MEACAGSSLRLEVCAGSPSSRREGSPPPSRLPETLSLLLEGFTGSASILRMELVGSGFSFRTGGAGSFCAGGVSPSSRFAERVVSPSSCREELEDSSLFGDGLRLSVGVVSPSSCREELEDSSLFGAGLRLTVGVVSPLSSLSDGALLPEGPGCSLEGVVSPLPLDCGVCASVSGFRFGRVLAQASSGSGSTTGLGFSVIAAGRSFAGAAGGLFSGSSAGAGEGLLSGASGWLPVSCVGAGSVGAGFSFAGGFVGVVGVGAGVGVAGAGVGVGCGVGVAGAGVGVEGVVLVVPPVSFRDGED